MEMNIRPVTSEDIHCKYPGQHEPQKIVIEINPSNGTLRAFYDPEIGGAVPMDVYHFHRIWQWCDGGLSCRAVRAILRDVAPLADRVCDGHTVEWDGNNMSGRLTPDAESALDQLSAVIEMRAYEACHGSH
jgi:hypothetical protein